MLPNDNYLIRKTSTKKTQVLHHMRMRQFTPRQALPDIPITPQELKPDPEVNIKNDDLDARAWECEHERPIFDAKNDNATPPNSPETVIQSDLSTEETRITPGTARAFPGNFSPSGGIMWRTRYVSLHGTCCGSQLGTTEQQSDQTPQFEI